LALIAAEALGTEDRYQHFPHRIEPVIVEIDGQTLHPRILKSSDVDDVVVGRFDGELFTSRRGWRDG
jgi:hypothetical protein